MQYRGIKYQTYVAVTTVCCTMLCASLNCERKSKENCLEDCQWSKVDKCIDCPDGFYGINCSRQCRYPNYGKDCQQDCSHCNREICNSTVGCLTQDGAIERGDSNLPMVIGIVVGVSAVLVIATLLIIELVNRRFYSRQIKLNAHYVGSVMSEHITSTLWRPTEQRIDICDVDISTDNSIYMLADSRRYENM
uniref:Uncharacterized protein n=1 Tax=Magallana gigas TaxID=29159 RepID=A0A8W8MI25_MAGGI|nr:uncharacterized protein LOC105334205 [Crassostrea gigas]